LREDLFMKTLIEPLPDCRLELHVDIPSADVNGERDQLILSFGRQAKVPGYRPGKVPRAIIEKRYAKELIQELEDLLVRKGLRGGIEEHKLELIDVGDVTNKVHHPDGSFTFIAELTVAPEVELPDYKNIPVELPRIEVGEEDIDRVLDQMADEGAKYEVVEGRTVDRGDVAVLDYTGSLDGTFLGDLEIEIPDHLSGREDMWLLMDERNHLPGFVEGVLGMAAGDKRTLVIELPEDIGVEELAGKEVHYDVSLAEVRGKVLPAIDDAFAAGIEEGMDLASLREAIKESLLSSKVQERDRILTGKVLTYLNDNLTFALPESMVALETERAAEEIAYRNYMDGIGQDVIEANAEKIYEAAAQRAQGSVKVRFILQEIAEAEGIEVSNEELLRVVAGIAGRERKSMKKLFKDMQRARTLPYLAEDIQRQKALDMVKKHALITEVDPEPAPRLGEGEGEGEGEAGG
jgi:trigger factor